MKLTRIKIKNTSRVKYISSIMISFMFVFTGLSMIIPDNTEAVWLEYTVNAPYAVEYYATRTPLNIYGNQATTKLRADDGLIDQYQFASTTQWCFGTSWYDDTNDTDLYPSYSEESWPLTANQLANLTITEVRIVAISRVVNPHDFVPGHFIFLNNYSLDPTWPHANLYLPNSTLGGWSSCFNTSEIYDFDETGTYDFLVSREVTEAYDEWDYNDFFPSAGMPRWRCWFWTNVSTTPQYWDYIGITFKYTYGVDYTLGEDVATESHIYGFIWLFIAFAPGLVMGQIIPKFGILVGLSIMVIGIGIMYPSFLPVTLVGLVGTGIYFYKGENQ